MTADVPLEYQGHDLPDRFETLRHALAKHAFILTATGNAKKTLRVPHGDQNRGYINSTVIQRQGVLGYRFTGGERDSDSCPQERIERLEGEFCERYACSPKALDIYVGTGSIAGRTFQIFRDPQVAIRVLLRDAGIELDPNTHVALVKSEFVEGKLVDVVVQRRERSEETRTARLTAYGFDCFVCGENLKAKYGGLPTEVVHVHHEEPLSQAEGERAFDPVMTMKPVCPNCHCAIHSRTPPYPIADVKAMLKHHD